MSARIEIGPYVIKADAGGGWVVGIPRPCHAQGREKVVERIGDPSYHARFDHALVGLLHRTLRESDATSLAEVRDIIQDFKEQCAALLDAA